MSLEQQIALLKKNIELTEKLIEKNNIIIALIKERISLRNQLEKAQ